MLDKPYLECSEAERTRNGFYLYVERKKVWTEDYKEYTWNAKEVEARSNQYLLIDFEGYKHVIWC